MYVSDDRAPQLGEGWLDTIIGAGQTVLQTVTGKTTAEAQAKAATAAAKASQAEASRLQAEKELTLAQKAAQAVKSPLGISAGVLIAGAAAAFFLLRKKK